MKPIITVDGISKRYTIGKKETYGSLRDEVMDAISSPFRRVFGKVEAEEDPSVWALKDVSFEVFEGDVLGIIGRNGAGKSTLLKILSRITEPTEGKIEMRGRLASLLEVGTGFHPELTGRENIFMNGALLGMTSREIKARFDEIVAFSEIEKFLDTPVKRYSSGMYVRLAFAVAAHLEPEILVIDEVLAVGDSAFQKKCLGKMGEVAKGGRTVLFVSHNMAAVQKLCTRAVLLEGGKVMKAGETELVIKDYISGSVKTTGALDFYGMARSGSFGQRARISGASVINAEGKATGTLRFGEPFSIEIECKGLSDVRGMQFVAGISSSADQRISTIVSKATVDIQNGDRKKGTVKIKDLYLLPGQYLLTFSLRDAFSGIDQLLNVMSFSVESVRHADAVADELFLGLIHIQRPEWIIK